MNVFEKKNDFMELLEGEKIVSVYQPIISLESGSILGYEALSRIDMDSCSFHVEEMFILAEALGRSWQLEELCRKKSIKNARNKPRGEKLFINVSPGIMNDVDFEEGVTEKILSQYNLSAEEIVFEITERTSIADPTKFREIIDHYRKRNFQIAIDDFGAGYAGLNRLSVLHPKYIKIDMALVRDIDKDEIKQSLVEGFVLFCKNANMRLIAEGIETKEELIQLIRLGVDYGQGYYIQKPKKEMQKISKELIALITKTFWSKLSGNYKPSFFGSVGTISKKKNVSHVEKSGFDLFEELRIDETINEVCVTDDSEIVCGMITRHLLNEKYGGRYGYYLHFKKTCGEIMDENFLAVDENTPIEVVSKMALIRPECNIYDSVIVTSAGKYHGVVTVKDLLESAVEIQVSRAGDANPLTGLPGNVAIEKAVEEHIYGTKPYSIVYLDLDNFKAYNDAYGFNNGDLMIKTMVKCIHECCKKNEFKGHVGGDDFVIIADYFDIEMLCEKIIEEFRKEVQSLYSEDDWERQYIVSKNRNGFQDTFPIVTISIAIMDNKFLKFDSLNEFSKKLAMIKKESKKVIGNSIKRIGLVI